MDIPIKTAARLRCKTCHTFFDIDMENAAPCPNCFGQVNSDPFPQWADGRPHERVVWTSSFPEPSDKTEPPSILIEADSLINGDRQQDYGPPEVNFIRIAKLWSIILGHDITWDHVILCLIQLKVARALEGV